MSVTDDAVLSHRQQLTSSIGENGKPLWMLCLILLGHIKCLGELIQWGESLFEHAGLVFGHGTQGAGDEAALLILWSIGLSPQGTEHDKPQHRVGAIRSNLFECLVGRRYDVIISNPPYVDDHTVASLPVEFRHEPARGLAGGSDGLAVVERIHEQVARYLQTHGVLLMEVGQSESRLLEKYPQIPFNMA